VSCSLVKNSKNPLQQNLNNFSILVLVKILLQI